MTHLLLIFSFCNCRHKASLYYIIIDWTKHPLPTRRFILNYFQNWTKKKYFASGECFVMTPIQYRKSLYTWVHSTFSNSTFLFEFPYNCRMTTRQRHEDYSTSNVVRVLHPTRPLSPNNSATDVDNNLGESWFYLRILCVLFSASCSVSHYFFFRKQIRPFNR